MDRTLRRAMRNKKNIGLVLGVVLLFVLGISGWFYLKPLKSNSDTQDILGNKAKESSPESEPEKEIDFKSSSTKELFEQAMSFYQKKKYQEAENAYKDILIKEPENLDVLLALGNTYRDWEKIDLAIAQYEKVINSDPHNITAYLDLAQLYASQNQREKAEQVLKNGLKKNPGNSDLQNSLDILYITPHAEEERG